jgi:outer membrane immunogenic protein
MRKLLLATTTFVAMTAGSGSAADLPAKARPAPCQCTCDAAQWGGGYIGISGGGIKQIAHRQDLDGFMQEEAGYTTDKWGGLVGLTLGYNFASCRTIWGFEIDGSWASVDKTLTIDANAGANNQETLENRMNGFFTARLRAGVALDNLFLYVTGGVAAARFRTVYTDFNPPVQTVEFSELRWGWVTGIGTEWAWTPNLSIKSEFLYANFADRDHSFNFPNFGPALFNHSDEVWVTRIGLNYRWGGAPVWGM